MNLKIKKLHTDAVVPKFAHVSDAGMDIFCVEDMSLEPFERGLAKTGLSFEFPEQYVCLVWDKSSISFKRGVKTLAGVVDAGYRGEILIAVVNLSNEVFEIKKGEKIAQIIFQEIVRPEIEEVDELSDTQRGLGGFGSTGK